MIAVTLCLAQIAERWIGELGSENYGVREAATAHLEDAGDETLPLLREAARSHDLEVAARARMVLKRRRTLLLKGFGVVVGLDGSGDSPGGETTDMLKNILGNELGRVVEEVDTRNAALVAVTALVPRSQKAGTTLDVQVAAIGDAKSIMGGTLFLTPLLGPRDTRILGLAQGRIVVEGDPTSGTIKNGMMVELTVP